MKSVNPNYKFVILSGLLWPLIIVNLAAGKITGTYIVPAILRKFEQSYIIAGYTIASSIMAVDITKNNTRGVGYYCE